MNSSAIATHPNLTQDAFVVRDPDLDLSPMTGMTRKHYIECAQYVLGRAFRHVKSFDSANCLSPRAGQVLSPA